MEELQLPQLILEGLNALNNNTSTPNVDLRNTIGNFFANSRTNRGQAWRPPVDMVDSKDILDIYIDLPAIDKKSIDLDFYNNRLNLKGNRVRNYSHHQRHEITYGKFSRDIILPVSVTNKDNVSVTYKDGVLKISIDKRKESQNRFRVSIGDEDEEDSENKKLEHSEK